MPHGKWTELPHVSRRAYFVDHAAYIYVAPPVLIELRARPCKRTPSVAWHSACEPSHCVLGCACVLLVRTSAVERVFPSICTCVSARAKHA
eukprot:10986457-Alexandrium_andersonii.AAC.1